MFLVRLGLKNLTRHKRRTLITALSIAVGLVIYIFADSLMAGMEEMAFNNIINLETAHLAVMEEEYWDVHEELPLDKLIVETDAIISELTKEPGVSEVTPRVKFGMMVNNGIDELPVLGIGIDPLQEVKMFTLHQYITSGRMLEPGQLEVLIGEKLAELMDFTLGSYMTVVTKTKNGAYQAFEAEIVGLLKTSDPAIDNETVYVPLDVVQEQLLLGSAVTEICVSVADRKQLNNLLPVLSARLADAGYNVELIGWETLAQTFIQFMRGQRGQNALVMLLIIIISIVGVVNTVVLAAIERTEEVGMLKALGLKEKEIVFNFMVEGVGIGILGGILGCVLAFVGVLYLTNVGVDISLPNIPVQDRVYGIWNIATFIGAILLGGIVAFVSSIFPAFRASRKDPIEAIYRR